LTVVNPPTARLLSKPAEEYIEKMMQHKKVEGQIDALLKKMWSQTSN